MNNSPERRTSIVGIAGRSSNVWSGSSVELDSWDGGGPMRRFGLMQAIGWLAVLGAASAGNAQAPTGPITPAPGTPVQQGPAENRIVSRVSLVNTPVTVRDSKGQMIANLDEKDFRVTDNGVAQKITHFDLGGDPLSLVILVETSARIAPLFAQVQKTGIVRTAQWRV